jgi:uncharacterized protein YeaC (DUF1315 family)
MQPLAFREVFQNRVFRMYVSPRDVKWPGGLCLTWAETKRFMQIVQYWQSNEVQKVTMGGVCSSDEEDKIAEFL